MNFFERQDQAQRQTKRLVVLYGLAVLGTFLAIHSLVAGIAAAGAEGDDSFLAVSLMGEDVPNFWRAWFIPSLFAIDALVVFIIIGGGTAFKVSQLRETGGDGVAISFGGTLVSPQTTDPKERRLLNVVEEMAIASGLNVPNVYILKDEPSINAFAAGFTPATSVVAVTQGTLDYLNRDELQGVIGHEFSHILHQDTGLNLKLIGVLFGLELIAMFGLIAFRIGQEILFVSGGRRSDRDEGNSTAAIAFGLLGIGLAVFLIGLIGQLFSNLIRAAISRQREFLADASSVQYTRNPMGIANALKKIGSPHLGSQIACHKAVGASHMFFGNVLSPGFFSHLFDSHPDLTTRIQRIDPHFDGIFPESVEPCNNYGIAEEEERKRRTNISNAAERIKDSPLGKILPQTGTPLVSPLAPSPKSVGNTISVSAAASVPLTASILEGVGELSDQKLKVADALLEKIPGSLVLLIRQPQGAVAALLAVLLDKNSAIHQKQVSVLNSKLTPSLVTQVRKVYQLLMAHSESIKIPIVQMAFPSLRSISKADYLVYRSVLSELMKADEKIDILEFTIIGFVVRDLDRVFGLSQAQTPKYHKITLLLSPFRAVASFIAYAGNDNSEEVRKAFGEAMSVFGLDTPILPKSGVSPAVFAKSLTGLTQASFPLRRQILTALYRCVAADGVITEREGELIRAVTAHLECPMPVWENFAAETK